MRRALVPCTDAILRERCAPVESVADHQSLIDDMLETVQAEKALGLAAPQVGVAARVIVLNVPEKPCFAMINPEIVRSSGLVDSVEGCLSIPGERYRVVRAERIVVDFHHRNGARSHAAVGGLLAIAVQHEIDHLDGRLISDRGERVS